MMNCPQCSATISAHAASCPRCGHPINPAGKNPGVAAVLSLVIPGAGQMYKGQVGNGVAWLIVVTLGYVLFVVPGLVLHLVCIIGASRPARAGK